MSHDFDGRLVDHLPLHRKHYPAYVVNLEIKSVEDALRVSSLVTMHLKNPYRNNPYKRGHQLGKRDRWPLIRVFPSSVSLTIVNAPGKNIIVSNCAHIVGGSSQNVLQLV